MPQRIAYLDLEITQEGAVADIGCFINDELQYHGNSIKELLNFIDGIDFLCGHNLINHDLKHLKDIQLNKLLKNVQPIDTLYLSPLLFPAKPYHSLLKDDKLDPENHNNPLNDAIKAKQLFEDEISSFRKLPALLQRIFYFLLKDKKEFTGFFNYLGYIDNSADIKGLIVAEFAKKICSNIPLQQLIQDKPIALAYCLALINANDRTSILPPWVIKNYPDVQQCLNLLRNKPCLQGCTYCNEKLNPHAALKYWFGFDQFRAFDGVPLQENAINAAIQGKSLLTIFPTGGGKSITFQLPALMSGESERGLTIVISPLQSLMKDQVDNLEKKGITDAVTINGLLDPIERAKSIERIMQGGANLLYIAPESLRSNTIQRLLEGRHITRFVIDEAHCFSSWGQDFRVDYLYIGDFIKKLQENKNLSYQIPVSCFTATAKQKVIEDIKTYFRQKLNLELELYTTNVARTNLEFKVLEHQDDDDKYNTLRLLLDENKSPAIVYVSRTKKAEELAEKLLKDGFNAKYYHGKMDVQKRLQHQNSFMEGNTDIMVATSAFGMGVDKSDVGKVIHYEISDSLENYIQEAGRAGRDERISASCYVLYNEDDLNKHFLLLNQTKLTIKEIQEVWKAIKELTRARSKISNSALEIARKAGWDDEVADIETRIITAIAALENSGYLERGNNSPRIFATGIISKTAQEAVNKINQSQIITEDDKTNAIRIIKKLFSAKRASEAADEDAESRIDYIADHLGMQKEKIIHIINLLRQEKILADTKDLTAFIRKNPRAADNALATTSKCILLEDFLLKQLNGDDFAVHLKELNEKATQHIQEDVTPSQLKTIFNIWSIQGWIKKEKGGNEHYLIKPKHTVAELNEKLELKRAFAGTIVRYLFDKAQNSVKSEADEILIEFSVQELQEFFIRTNQLFDKPVTAKDIEDILFYLSRIEAIKIEGGFMVLYNRLTIERKEMNSQIKYKKEDYQKLEEFYLNKIQQIHIVGEYATRMIHNYKEALQFVDDYFQLNYNSFLARYFPGNRKKDINLKITKKKFEELFGSLSLEQSAIINDNESQYIVVAAGPGSGKTKVLVHKLASLLQMEDVKHEQLLMLTFSRAAAMEFKTRLQKLIGNAAYFVEIKTFHSYCFDLSGKVGDLEKSDKIIQDTIKKIRANEIVLNRITKAVLVIDEAQDINTHEFELIKLLVEKNEDMRVILVGDDDQNIFEWRDASSACMLWFLYQKRAKPYTMLDNYRSKEEIVLFANHFVSCIQRRLKTKSILSKNGAGGKVNITEYESSNLIVPLTGSILQSGLKGSTCVLTKTNYEAALIAGLLRKHDYSVKLIQSNDGFRLSNMLELRYFSELIMGLATDGPKIDNDDFKDAIQTFKQTFAGSSKKGLALEIIEQFFKTHQNRIYKSDWRSFLEESKLDEFYIYDSETIYVSTIHKSKGKEFENVFLMLSNHLLKNEEDKRLVYVAITRAKRNLEIHYDQSFFSFATGLNFSYQYDNLPYSLPETLSLLLTHKDVYLDYFFNPYRQKKITELLPGTKLSFSNDNSGCSYNGADILKFSNNFKSSIDCYLRSGYTFKSATVQFVIYWKHEEKDEIKIILPEVILEKSPL